MTIWNTTVGEKWPNSNDFKPDENPFVRDEAGSIKSPSAISRAIRADEPKARAMCRSAGEPLAKWFSENPQ